MEHTKAFWGIGRSDAAQAIARLVAETDGIAVRPDHRREGIGRKIKLFCDSFAAEHHAAIMVSVTTNHESACLNDKTKHIVFERCDGLVIKYADAVNKPFGFTLLTGVSPKRHGPSPYSEKRMDLP